MNIIFSQIMDREAFVYIVHPNLAEMWSYGDGSLLTRNLFLLGSLHY